MKIERFSDISFVNEKHSFCYWDIFELEIELKSFIAMMNK